MWESDTPRPAPIDLWSGVVETSQTIGADLVVTGYGGDEVLDQYNVLSDLLRHGNLARWSHGVRAYSSWSGRGLGEFATDSLRGVLPAPLKRSIRHVLRRSDLPAHSLIRSDVWSELTAQRVAENPADMGFPSSTQNLVVSYTREPLLVLLLEYDEMRHARAGLDVTSPFLDRRLVEYVASIPIARRPLDTCTKTLARNGFSDWLPSSVIDLRTKTVQGAISTPSSLGSVRISEAVSRPYPEPRVPSSTATSTDRESPRWMPGPRLSSNMDRSGAPGPS